MKKQKIGVICPSEIAFRRFMPALKKVDNLDFAGVATAVKSEWKGEISEELLSADKAKAQNFIGNYGGRIYNSYTELLKDKEVDCVYIPLPPALHFEWAKKALENGKHVLLEKPFTTSLSDTDTLINIAKERNLALHENYMFQYHSQIEWILSRLPELGEIRLFRIDFGFPFRGSNDFRYNKLLGGGALLDCGGYTLKLASILLGDTARITDASLSYKDGFEVDIYGFATLRNNKGLTAQVSFGMDNSYRCSLDIWGSNGSLYTNRILTAPVDYTPIIIINNNQLNEYKIESCDCMYLSIVKFNELIINATSKFNEYSEIKHQAVLINKFMEITINENN